ncbi:Mtm1p KNAG_0K00380 [Huiozyma naganishii CBS 8797]|uniref:Mitochondrial carrier protein MTM1 n=1 Tax=Huiozyma naganishii (strain ATCC MYA-139 / BCRC 22969 / CBS 8797 / KCTC 17520 / NBRC 10181 / NCYC 3082 / Yp74L-3) TaxID=1071383 RepID=J7SAR2_HUIN7|nr:hypothetical protein KNAG_0K00380 [Kazachstania naganishii CBS 8797]CCK72406.1 hypothetical protein KNAG_0K00380 [Kazachstania naganishii CBS 8797]
MSENNVAGGGTAQWLGFQERMLSASVGSLLTSMTLTPMDVVRIRLQQQSMTQLCGCDDIGGEGGAGSLRQATVRRLPRAAGAAAEAEARRVFWEGACFAELNCRRSHVPLRGTWDALLQISRNEGCSTLWRGISLTLAMAIPANVVYFTGYEYVRDVSPLRGVYPTLNPLLCGAVARLLAATTVAPLELLKTKFQSIPRSSERVRAAAIFKDLLQETRLEIQGQGLRRALFKGLQITLWRDVPFSGIYWASYEWCKRSLWAGNAQGSNAVHFANSFIGGCVSGTLAAVATHPFDVGKTRLQIRMLQGGTGGAPTGEPRMFRYLAGIWRSEGASGLYAGLGARVAKIAPSCAIMISSYEVSKKFFT